MGPVGGRSPGQLSGPAVSGDSMPTPGGTKKGARLVEAGALVGLGFRFSGS
jgi:hypothetical protein